MALPLPDLRTLDPDAVDQVQGETAQRLQEAYPQADQKRGVLGDTVLHLHAVLMTAVGTLLAQKERSDSLLGIADQPTAADPTLVDKVLSNYRVQRGAGVRASGQMTIVVSRLIPTTVPAGAVFTANGIAFQTPAAYAARESPAQVAATTDRVLRPIGDGLYAYTVPVVAVAAGTAGLLRRGANLVPAQRIPNFVRAYAEGDFAGGFDAESNADLMRRLQQGIAAPAWSNRATIDAMIHAQPDFARVLQTSIIGFGDPEMHRDQHTVLPISTGGRCDLYARTQSVPASVLLTKTCTLIEKTAEGGLWSVSIHRDDAPGFYRVDRVGPPGSPQDTAGYEVVADIRDFDASGPGFVPDVRTAVEAAYSRYQTATIRFLDTAGDVTGLVVNTTTAPYDLVLSYMPQIADLQLFTGDRRVRNPAGDVLVKAPIPCDTTISFSIRQPATAEPPDLVAIAEAVAAAVNNLGFPGQLHASMVADIVSDMIPEGSYLSAVDMAGRIRRPDGVLRRIRSSEVLLIPDEPEFLVSPRTTAFLLDPQDVGVTVKTLALPEI